MSTSPKTLENLQKALSMELTAVHQYLLHAHTLEDWGLDLLAARMREEVQEELGHASKYIDRILFLKGDPKMVPDETAKTADTLEDMFAADLDGEKEAIRFYTEAAETAEADHDVGTRRLFENIVLDEEGHQEWLELQLDLLKRMGEPMFISKHMSKPTGE